MNSDERLIINCCIQKTVLASAEWIYILIIYIIYGCREKIGKIIFFVDKMLAPDRHTYIRRHAVKPMDFGHRTGGYRRNLIIFCIIYSI